MNAKTSAAAAAVLGLLFVQAAARAADVVSPEDVGL